MRNRLTIKQSRFVDEYLKDGNASRAYRVSYDAQNMSATVIHVKACELLKNGKVAVAVDAAREQMAAKAEIGRDEVVQMLLLDRERAHERRQTSAAVAAAMGIAKVLGHLTEDRRNERSPLQDLPIQHLKALACALDDEEDDKSLGVVH